MAANPLNIDFSKMPNPRAMEAWLEPSMVENSRIFDRLVVGCLAIAGWDALASFTADIRLLGTGTFNFQKLAYLSVRISSFAFVLVTAISGSIKQPSCSFWNHLADIFYVVAQAAIGLLFYFRVVAVWHAVKAVILFFRIAWLGLVVGAILVPIALKSSRLEGTEFCLLLVTRPYYIAQAFTRVAYDLLVCAAVTYKLGHNDEDEQAASGCASWFLGRRATFRFSLLKRRLLRDSHIYFMITAIFKVLEIATFFGLQASGRYFSLQIIIAFPDVVITGILATRIYRKLKLNQPGIWPHTAVATTPQSLTFLGRNTSIALGIPQETKKDDEQHIYPPS
ncbi:hypothetical protein CPB83DRAFT_899970 [Crepidotus variabilis]|uniref:Uncharacterized protein n=1 Tax=Crepidotus variabilis TaxID=179855 RepID=A0A9P6JID6_9AGAR|nr:hypothetical protein CPB83DRAFT_899970 [Crepidotus variabilis]